MEKVPSPFIYGTYPASDKFMPIFFEEYQNKLNYSSTIGSIYKEYIQNIKPSIDNLYELNKMGTNITSKKMK